MRDTELDERIAQVVLGLIQVRRSLDPETFADLLGAVIVEIDLGVQVAVELALEAKLRRVEGNVVPFRAPSNHGSR